MARRDLAIRLVDRQEPIPTEAQALHLDFGLPYRIYSDDGIGCR
jgi:hypothetical protein